jgi:hypothetical protein
VTDLLNSDSSPLEKMRALLNVSELSGAGRAHLVSRDGAGKILSVAVYAEGEDAIALEKFLSAEKRRRRKAPRDISEAR